MQRSYTQRELEHQRRQITTRAPLYSHFRTCPPFRPYAWWCPENFVMISWTVQELSRWQTNRQTDRQTHKQTPLKQSHRSCACGKHILRDN